MTSIATLATSLLTLFTTTASTLGLRSGLFRRRRDITADKLAQALVFGWIDNPRSSLECLALRLGVSAQALHQRMTPEAKVFFELLLAHALTLIHNAKPTRLRLFKRFTGVIVEDSTTILLPRDCAEQWRGHGGSDPDKGKASMKVLVRWDLQTGKLLALRCVPGVTNDTTLAATAADLPVGALHLADQGFFDASRWAGYTDRYWISRVPARICVCLGGVWQPLTQWLASLSEEQHDGPALLVESQGLACRLTARRCSVEVAARRRQKLREHTKAKKGREPSKAQLAACDWQVLATNVPAEWLTAKELWLVYRSRWQIELLFKRSKQQMGLEFSHGRKGERVVVEVLAKLLGSVVMLWSALIGGGPLEGRSPTTQYAVVRSYALLLQQGISVGAGLERLLQQLKKELGRIRRQPKRKKQPSTRQILNNPLLIQ